MADPTEPGWYPDPYGADEPRWFDGQRWLGSASDYGYSESAPSATSAGDARDQWWRRLNPRDWLVAGVAVLVVASGAYWYAGRSTGPAAVATSSIPGVAVTGSFCKDFQTGVAGGITSVSFDGTETRAAALAKLTSFQKSIQTIQSLVPALSSEEPSTAVRAGLAAEATLTAKLVGPLQSAITAVTALSVNATTSAVATADGPLTGAIFAAALEIGATNGKALQALPKALNAACGAGYAAKQGLS